MSVSMDVRADTLVARIKHYLITQMGKTLEETRPAEFYRALAYALREEVMVSWMATQKTFKKFQTRRLYYLSMEYLPGRILGNDITNLHSFEFVQKVVKQLGFSLEHIGNCEMDPGLGNGGLGRLASCFLDALATNHYPSMAYGLRYHYGMFEQEIWDGVQVERPDCWLLNDNPWELRQDEDRRVVKFGGLVHTTQKDGYEYASLQSYDDVRAIPYDLPIVGYGTANDHPSAITLRLWTTKESPRNFRLQRYNAGRLDQAAENIALTDVLYPVDVHDTGRRARVKQEFLLVSASLQDIFGHYLKNFDTFDQFADKVRIQINDTHPALIIAEMMRLLTERYHLSWSKSLEITRECCGYTNHTILREALEEWDRHLIQHLLPRQYAVIERLNHDFLEEVRERFPDDEEKVQRLSIFGEGKIRMAHLAIYGSHRVNGVAELHTKILKSQVFPDFVELYPDRFIAITNGVTQRRWLLHCNPKLADFVTKRIGDAWIKDFSQIRKLESFASDPESQKEFLAIKEQNKKRFIKWLSENHKERDVSGMPIDQQLNLDHTALFDVQIKRIHEYKRQLLNALHLILLYQELKKNPSSRSVPRVVIIAGKAAAGYEAAKTIIQLIHSIARKVNNDPDIQGKLKVIFIENYNVSRAEMIIPSADLSEQISTAGLEASGTGNMKLSINGALTIGTADGANVEMKEEVSGKWWPFEFGLKSEEIHQLRLQDSYDPWSYYHKDGQISQAVDALRDGSLSSSPAEQEAFYSLYYSLLEGGNHQNPDPYFVLADFADYIQTQKRVEALFLEPEKWAEMAIHNMAGMGKFSADVSIHKYCKEVWDIEAQPLDSHIVKDARKVYCEHDQFCVWRED